MRSPDRSPSKAPRSATRSPSAFARLVVTSAATASGNDKVMAGRFNGDPFCAAVCPGCGTEWPRTRIEGIGPTAVRCDACGADATPFTFANGYTIAFDDERQVGLTVGKAGGRSHGAGRGAADGAAGHLDPEPDPDLRAGRSRRRRHAAAAVPRPARHHAVEGDAGFAQCRGFRRLPGRRAAHLSR